MAPNRLGTTSLGNHDFQSRSKYIFFFFFLLMNKQIEMGHNVDGIEVYLLFIHLMKL